MPLSKLRKSSLFVKNFIIYALGLVLSGLVSFYTIPVIIKRYGVDVYGNFSLLQNLVFISLSFGGGWLNQSVLRFNDYSQTFKMRMYVLFFICFIGIFFIDMLLALYMTQSWIQSILISFTAVVGGLAALYITFNQSNFKATTTFLNNMIRVGSFLLAIILLPKTIEYLIVSFALSYILSMIFLFKGDYEITKISFLQSISSVGSIKKIKTIIRENRQYINYGFPLALWFVISMTLAVFDRFLIKFYFDDNTLGIYSGIQDMLAKGITMICSPILIAGYPMITKLYNAGDESRAYTLLRKLMLVELSILVITIVVAYFGRDFFIQDILHLELNDEVRGIVIPITIGVFLWQFAMLAHKRLELKGNTTQMLVAVIIGIFVNVILNLLFLPIFGYSFAAYSYIVSSLIYLFYVSLVKNKT